MYLASFALCICTQHCASGDAGFEVIDECGTHWIHFNGPFTLASTFACAFAFASNCNIASMGCSVKRKEWVQNPFFALDANYKLKCKKIHTVKGPLIVDIMDWQRWIQDFLQTGSLILWYAISFSKTPWNRAKNIPWEAGGAARRSYTVGDIIANYWDVNIFMKKITW